MDRKLLVTGSSGLLGATLVRSAVGHYDVAASSFSSPRSAGPVESMRMDITDRDEVMAEVGACYRETDAPNPINAYARSKLRGENHVRECASRHVIVRTNMYGWNLLPKQSLAEWILGRLREGKTVPGFTDVVFNPLLVNDLSDLLLTICDHGLEGTYHLGAGDHASKHRFAQMIAELYGIDPARVEPVDSDKVDMAARRPKVTYLDCSVIEGVLGCRMPALDAGLRRFRTLEDEAYQEDLRRGSAW